MKIQSLLLNNIILKNKEDMFKEGNILEGKIVDILGKNIIIDIKNYGTFEANLETDLNIKLDDEVSFLVKSSDDNKVQLKPLVQEELISYKSIHKKENDSIIKLLKGLNIKETKESIEIVKSLMKYNIPITEKNLNYCIKTLDKLYQLSNLKEDDKVILLNSTNLNESLAEDNDISVEKMDIKSFLIIDKDEFKEYRDISQQIKNFMGNESKVLMENQPKLSIIKGTEESIINNIDIDFSDEDIKIITFFLKNNIKSSLNNIKNIRDFNEDPIEFSKDFKEIDNILSKIKSPELTKAKAMSYEDNILKNINLIKDERVVELQKIINNLKNDSDLQLREDLNRLESKIDFLNEINRDLSFVFFPINYEKRNLDGIITLIKEDKRKKRNNDKINIFINLETHNLGNIKVSCELSSNNLYIKINVKRKDLELFKSTEQHLVEKIQSIGYSLDRVEFIIDDNIEIIDTIIPNPVPTYILDLKV
ncbi:hypothetical protein RBU61_08560 [Tissierella sp. MB52-C2]|uniref:hypothetical protein n=1 Tax=Tissierella sp. MB52-C2 TaxID=3070999 RepID=UPI00280B1957|nr:hypothetical protein [Tissierella sp. MB52-C2]WMM26717.1 hypothetical protein RBU61_08560 [Tissierella sp. MB52-C2]